MAVNPLFRNKLRHFQSRYLIDEILGHFNSYSYNQRKLKNVFKAYTNQLLAPKFEFEYVISFNLQIKIILE